jgi:hypothetical protein
MKPTPKMKAALEAFDKRIRNRQPVKGASIAFRKIYTQYRNDMRAVLRACEKGDWNRASLLAGRLDTVLRDEIPQYLWDAMHES